MQVKRRYVAGVAVLVGGEGVNGVRGAMVNWLRGLEGEGVLGGRVIAAAIGFGEVVWTMDLEPRSEDMRTKDRAFGRIRSDSETYD